MRILHLSAPASAGGLETVVTLLSSKMRDAGYDVHVGAMLTREESTNHPFIAGLNSASVPVHVVQDGRRDYLRTLRGIVELASRLEVSVIHTHGPKADVLGALTARFLNVPHVLTLHGFVDIDGKQRLYRWMQLRTARSAAAVIAVSRSIVSRLADHDVVENVTLIPNAFRSSAEFLDRREAREYLGLREDSVVVGWVGRLSLEKGPDIFADAIALLPTRLEGVLVGDGPMRSLIERSAERTVLRERLRCVGTIPGASRLLRAFDVLALTSRSEGTPMIILEAMDAGVPIVAAKVGGVPDILSESEAYLFQPDNAVAAAAAIERAVGDASAASRARAAHDRLVRDFAPGNWISAHAELYKSILQGASFGG